MILIGEDMEKQKIVVYNGTEIWLLFLICGAFVIMGANALSPMTKLGAAILIGIGIGGMITTTLMLLKLQR